MRLPEGVHTLEGSTLSEICADGCIVFDRSEHWVEFGVRWADGELAEDVLVVDTDGYYDGPDQIEFSGQKYSLEFGEDLLKDALVSFNNTSTKNRPSAEIFLRYMIEFDAALEPRTERVGGKWVWGGMRGRPEKREPKDFHKRWRIL